MTVTAYTVCCLPGDGIGPEIMAASRAVLDAVAERFGFTVDCEDHLIGGAAIDACGCALPDATLEAARAADSVLLASVGGPRWDTTDPAAPRPEQGLLAIRKALGLYCNLRPVHVFDALEYGEGEIERVVRYAFEAAAGRPRATVCSVDKANVLGTSKLWRDVAHRVAAEYPQVAFSDMLVDNCAMQLVAWATARRSLSRATGRRPTSPERTWPTPWPRSSPWPSCYVTAWASPRPPTPWRQPWSAPSTTAGARLTSPTTPPRPTACWDARPWARGWRPTWPRGACSCRGGTRVRRPKRPTGGTAVALGARRTFYGWISARGSFCGYRPGVPSPAEASTGGFCRSRHP